MSQSFVIKLRVLNILAAFNIKTCELIMSLSFVIKLKVTSCRFEVVEYAFTDI